CKYPYCAEQGQFDIVFHGTETRNIPSIIRKGFLLPSDQHEIEHGDVWGAGIYFTRFLNLAADYGNDETLFLCATIMGRKYRCEKYRRNNIPVLPRGFNSHVSPCGKEGAVFCE